MERWNDLKTALDEFRGIFSDSPAWQPELLNDRDDNELYRSQLAARAFAGAGVYLHYSPSGDLLYVGMTMSGLHRCWDCRPQDCRWTDVVPPPNGFDLFVPALEIYLIRRLQPLNNKHRH